MKPARKTRLTAAPTTWTGGRVTGPSGIGSSRIGMAIARVPAPNARMAKPRSTAARPIVAMITEMIGRPISGRSTTRSRPKPRADHAGDRKQRRDPERRPAKPAAPAAIKAGEHDKFALGEIDRVGRLVDQHESQRDQRVHQPDHHPVDQQGQGELPIDPGHRLTQARRARAPARPRQRRCRSPCGASSPPCGRPR